MLCFTQHQTAKGRRKAQTPAKDDSRLFYNLQICNHVTGLNILPVKESHFYLGLSANFFPDRMPHLTRLKNNTEHAVTRIGSRLWRVDPRPRIRSYTQFYTAWLGRFRTILLRDTQNCPATGVIGQTYLASSFYELVLTFALLCSCDRKR